MSMTAAWLTDNRRLDVLDYDDEAGPAGRRRRRRSCRRWCRPARSSGRCSPTVAAELGISPAAQVVTGMPDLHAATRRVRAASSTTRRTCRSAPRRGSAARCRARRPTCSGRWRPCPGLGARAAVPARQQPGQRRPLPPVVPRQRRVRRRRRPAPSYADITALAATVPGRRGRRDLHAVADRRAQPRRRPGRPGRVPQRLARDDPGATWPARCSRASRSTCGGCWRRPSTSPAAGSTRSGSSAAAPSPSCGARSSPTSATAPSSGSPSPLLCGLRGVALAAGLALRRRRRSAEVRALVPVDRVFRPDPADRATYDRLFAEFPRLYRAQRRMFARLNRRA